MRYDDRNRHKDEPEADLHAQPRLFRPWQRCGHPDPALNVTMGVLGAAGQRLSPPDCKSDALGLWRFDASSLHVPIMWDPGTDVFVIVDTTCCDVPMIDTGCDAVTCQGFRCEECGAGCDVDVATDGRCATSIAEESDEEYDQRLDAERAAWGLDPL